MYAEEIDFIRRLYGTDGFIPLHAPVFSGNEKQYLAECIDTTYVSSVGEFVDRFERGMAAFTGAARAVACVNGTNALHLALLLAGVRPDEEVITQPLSFVATANAISYCGARPVFLDVDTDTLGLSPVKMRHWLENHAEQRAGECFNKRTGRRIRACVPMHTFGHPARVDRLADLCTEWGIALVEDAAESLGSRYKGRHTGTFGQSGVLSFNGNKILTTGGGGMLLFDDEAAADRCKHLTTQAKVAHRWEFRHDRIGYNYRMPNLNAALGCAQLEELPDFIRRKRETAQAYRTFFSGHPEIEFCAEPENSVSNYWLCAVRMKDREARDAFLAETNDHGVMTRPVWELTHRLPMYRACECGELTHAEWLADRIVNLPSSVRTNSD